MDIIAVTGLIGSGKDEVGRHIAQKYGYQAVDFSEILGDMLREAGRPVNRKEKRKLRFERGGRFLAEKAVEILKNSSCEKAVLFGLRRPEDYEVPKKTFSGMKLIVVQADERIRFTRAIKRERDRPGSWEEFLAEDEKEEKLFQFSKTFTNADIVISNNSSLEELHKEIDAIMGNLNT